MEAVFFLLSGAQVEKSSEGDLTNEICQPFDDKGVENSMNEELMESLGEEAGTTGSQCTS